MSAHDGGSRLAARRAKVPGTGVKPAGGLPRAKEDAECHPPNVMRNLGTGQLKPAIALLQHSQNRIGPSIGIKVAIVRLGSRRITRYLPDRIFRDPLTTML